MLLKRPIFKNKQEKENYIKSELAWLCKTYKENPTVKNKMFIDIFAHQYSVPEESYSYIFKERPAIVIWL